MSRIPALLAALLAIVPACGGDDDDTQPPPADGGPDTAGPDSPAPDGGPEPTRLYAAMGEHFVILDETTGAGTLVGDMGTSQVQMAWDPSTQTLWAVAESDTGGRLATIDPCTGAASMLDPVAVGGGGPPTRVAGLASFGGMLYAAVSLDGDASAEKLATLDSGSATLTPLSDLDGTHEGNLDSLTEFRGVLWGVDADLGAGKGYLYTINPATGAITPSSQTQITTAVTEGPLQGQLYGWVFQGMNAQQLVVVHTDNGAAIPVGPTDPDGTFGAMVSSMARFQVQCP